jgi:hypothetical protein
MVDVQGLSPNFSHFSQKFAGVFNVICAHFSLSPFIYLLPGNLMLKVILEQNLIFSNYFRVPADFPQ